VRDALATAAWLACVVAPLGYALGILAGLLAVELRP